MSDFLTAAAAVWPWLFALAAATAVGLLAEVRLHAAREHAYAAGYDDAERAAGVEAGRAAGWHDPIPGSDTPLYDAAAMQHLSAALDRLDQPGRSA